MISKAEAGYVCNAGTDYLCGDCQFHKDANGARCAYYGPIIPISLTAGSCNRFKFGTGDVPWLKPYFTKIQLGYLENVPGFGCKRCEELLPKEHACKRVDKDTPGFTPGRIESTGCCDFWERDVVRGGMTDDQLSKALSGGRVVLRIGR